MFSVLVIRLRSLRLLRVSGIVMRLRMFLLLITFLKASHSFRNRLLVICKNAYLFATMIMTSVSSPFSCCSGIVRLNLVNNFNCRGFGPLLEDKLCLIFKLAPSVCRMTFPILASLLVRLVVLLPFQLLRLSLATPSRWTPLALSVFLHCVVALLLTLL